MLFLHFKSNSNKIQNTPRTQLLKGRQYLPKCSAESKKIKLYVLEKLFSTPSSSQRERDAGSRCIISMVSTSISIQDPRDSQNQRSFSFDYTYWSHSGFIRDYSGLYVPEEQGGRYADQVSVLET